MRKEKWYSNVRFSVDALREAVEEFRSRVNPEGRLDIDHHMVVDVDGASWTHDSEEEFLADYRRITTGAVFQEYVVVNESMFRLQDIQGTVVVQVKANDRASIEGVFEILEKYVDACRLPEKEIIKPSPPTIFIGT